MNNALPTAPAQIDLEGGERANALFRTEVMEVSMTLGETKSRMTNLMKEVNGDEEAEVRVQELMVGMNFIAVGHDNVKLEDMEHHIGGVNYAVGTNDTAVNQKQYTAEAIVTANTRNKLRGVVLHENDSNVGHAGQIAGIDTLVDARGSLIDARMQYEGNVEYQVAQVVGDRDDRPNDVYGEGLSFVTNVGAQEVNQYIRKDGAHAGDSVWMQTHIMRQSSLAPEQMQQALVQAGFTQGEVFQIVVGARSEAKEAVQPQMTLAAYDGSQIETLLPWPRQ